MFRLEFVTDGAAFVDDDGNPDAGPEIARILRGIADWYDSGIYSVNGPARPVYDVNGNRIGQWRLTGITAPVERSASLPDVIETRWVEPGMITVMVDGKEAPSYVVQASDHDSHVKAARLAVGISDDTAFLREHRREELSDGAGGGCRFYRVQPFRVN